MAWNDKVDTIDVEPVNGVGDPAPTTTTSGGVARRDDGGPCHWSGTFRNPCFWVLVGVAATLGFQYVMRRAK